MLRAQMSPAGSNPGLASAIDFLGRHNAAAVAWPKARVHVLPDEATNLGANGHSKSNTSSCNWPATYWASVETAPIGS